MINESSLTGPGTGVSVKAVESLTREPLPEAVTVTRWKNGEKVQTQAVPVPFGSERAQTIWQANPLGGDLYTRMTDEEVAYINALWEEMPGEYSFADTLLLVLREAAKSDGGTDQ